MGEEALAVGCMVSYWVEDDDGLGEVWDRFCCFEGECTNQDGPEEEGGDFVWNERYWNIKNKSQIFCFSCETDNCNTMDPRNNTPSNTL